MMGPYWYGGGWGGWGWMAFGWLTMVVFWGLVIVGVVAAIRWASRIPSARSDSSDTPVEILRRRYAAGELTKEQFEAMKQDVA